MFSKKMVMIIGAIILVVVNIIALSVTSRRHPAFTAGRIAIDLVAPFQDAVSRSIRFMSDTWRHYFFLVAVSQENDNLQRALSRAIEKNNQCNETQLSNTRLRSLLNFQKTMNQEVLAAEVIGKDPSPWYKTIIIDKGAEDGVTKGLAVVVPEGIAGQVMEVAAHYAKVLLIIDPNSAVDALVQRTRARGIIKGETGGRCLFKYVLRKHDLSVGEQVVSSGLDEVFPKGLGVGRVSGVVKRSSGIFQEVTVTPLVDFEKLEEVLVVLSPGQSQAVGE